jgi:hypothetical protein
MRNREEEIRKRVRLLPRRPYGFAKPKVAVMGGCRLQRTHAYAATKESMDM